MVAGKPDYWQSNYPSKVLFGSGQSQWYMSESANIPGGSFADLWQYTVPAGNSLVVGYTASACSGPGIQMSVLLRDSIEIAVQYYDVGAKMSLPDTSLYIFPPGSALIARVYNLDVVTLNFSIGAIGFLTMV